MFLGGPGEPYGAMLGALTIGVATEISAAYFNPEYKEVIAFVVLLGDAHVPSLRTLRKREDDLMSAIRLLPGHHHRLRCR